MRTAKLELRRECSVWGSYMWGFADVGANTFVALGLVMAYVQGATGLAFLVAGIVYIMIGLAYTELASAYPVAGGGPYYTLRALGDFWSFVAGSALVLAYTIDIALFAVASAGYLNFFLPFLTGHGIEHYAINLGPVSFNLLWCIETLVIIGFLILINIQGIRESSFLNEVIGVVIIISASTLIIVGFLFAWKPDLIAYQWNTQFPTLNNFMYGSSLAIISFIGLESISQVAQETRRPATIIPRTSITLVFTVFIFAISFSTLSLGMLPWQELAVHSDSPIAVLAEAIPYIGVVAGPFTAILGALMLLISANTGVVGASRLAYAMSQFQVIPTWFNEIHPKYRTPVRAVLAFSLIGVVQTIGSFMTPRVMDTLGHMYAFGATIGYILVFIALLRLRMIDPYTPRPYRMPGNIPLQYKGQRVSLPVMGFLGMIALILILYEILQTHPIVAKVGPLWLLLCFAYYARYRWKAGLPIFRSVPHHWEADQMQVLEAAEEFDLLEQYKLSLAERDRQLRKTQMASSPKG
jgi:APA family basic amino acid/polyamine antiporter